MNCSRRRAASSSTSSTSAVPSSARAMIAHLRGTLLATAPGRAIVDCHGVGYDVTVSMNTFTQLPEAGQEVSLFIYTYVREEQIALYGFHLSEEKALFEKLLSVSGIGPKLA